LASSELLEISLLLDSELLELVLLEVPLLLILEELDLLDVLLAQAARIKVHAATAAIALKAFICFFIKSFLSEIDRSSICSLPDGYILNCYTKDRLNFSVSEL
jgi:hypothetical protein